MTDPKFPNRPDHPDFWLISQAVIDTDAQADAGQGFDNIVGRYTDLASLTYAATHRTLRMAGRNAPDGLRAALGAMWMDAFIVGVRFQHLKATGAQRFE